MATALSRVARDAHLELLFDERLLAGKAASPDRKGKDPESRLHAILAGSGFTFRRTATGPYLIVAVPVRRLGAVPVPETEAPVADILVTARRTLNADLRRGRDDIQRYEVFDREAIGRSQSATVDSFLRSDFVDNRQIKALGQTPLLSEGSVRSQVDVHGLGAEQTLVLVDGRRLPRIASRGAFLQPDLSGLPIYGIDRIETIGTTAGGIFGIGAAGGAVNIIMRSEYDDVSAASRFGITDRGDAIERGASLHFGLTSRNGRTRVSVRVSASQSDGLTFGDRSYVEDALRLAVARDPSANSLPVSNGINIMGVGTSLTLLPAYGGATLASNRTFLPLDAPAVGSGGAAFLAANAGRTNLALSPDGQGARQTLITPARTSSLLLNAQQELGDRIVIYGDYLRLESAGHANIQSIVTLNTPVFAGQLGNPFTTPIYLTFPTVGSIGAIDNRAVTERLTVGGKVNLGHGWSASVDAAAGRSTFETKTYSAPAYSGAFNVFAGPAALAAQLAAVPVQRVSADFAANRLHDLNLKIAGSPFSLPAGKAYLTLTGEFREERSPGEIDTNDPTPTSSGFTKVVGAQRERVASIFAELRLPLIAQEDQIPFLRGLDLQVALRHDRYTLTAPIQSPALLANGSFGTEVTSRGGITGVTTGVRFRPLPGFTVRGSYATGYTPPTFSQITPVGSNTLTFNISDPKRGGVPPFSLIDRTFVLSGGTPEVKPQIAKTISVGVIVEPAFMPGLRVSVDYSRLRTSREISDYSAFDASYIVAHEDQLPGRVVRASPSAADIARGYTVGRIIRIDSTYLSVGRSSLEVVDAAIDFSRASAIGNFHVFAKASWEPSLLRQGDPDLPAYNSVNSALGPLSIRANAGLDWSKGSWSAGVSAQAYGAYRVTYAYQPGSAFEAGGLVLNQTAVAQQGGTGVPAQAYLDGYLGWRSTVGRLLGGSPEFTLRFGIKNLLDKRPPLVVPAVQAFNSLGYSYYGDPRGRRFVIDLSAKF